ncbi:recombinase family protein [Streptomyces sp. NPDC006290]|uniref:recombinase family protein n=1 Tax=Streptomyces sp. NPDC006290 TaxID=3156745 RepID=UPI0033A47642
MSRPKLAKAAITPGEPAAIYCRISHTKDEDQTGVDRQERICREIAERLQLGVESAHIYVDNNRSAWQRNRNRKRLGWEEMLQAMADGEIRHIIVYHPDRLMRQPKDLAELLSIADDKRVLLHGEANRRDLSDPDDRFILRIEVAHACRSSDDASRRLKDPEGQVPRGQAACGQSRSWTRPATSPRRPHAPRPT